MDAVGKVGLPAARRSGFNVASRARFARLKGISGMPGRQFLAGFLSVGRVAQSHAGTGGGNAFFTQPNVVSARCAIQDQRLGMNYLATIVHLFSQRRDLSPRRAA
jgi:hypothetical protein